MRGLKKLMIISAIFIFSSTAILAQSSAQSSANVTVQVKKGLSITNLSGDLDFGEVILTGNAQVETITPDNGVNFEVIGHPDKSVLITYNVSQLTDGTNNLTFNSDFKHTAENSTYTSPLDVISGNSYSLNDDGGVGKLYLWLGGNVDVEGAAEVDYTGSFNVTVAY